MYLSNIKCLFEALIILIIIDMYFFSNVSGLKFNDASVYTFISLFYFYYYRILICHTYDSIVNPVFKEIFFKSNIQFENNPTKYNTAINVILNT